MKLERFPLYLFTRRPFGSVEIESGDLWQAPSERCHCSNISGTSFNTKSPPCLAGFTNGDQEDYKESR